MKKYVPMFKEDENSDKISKVEKAIERAKIKVKQHIEHEKKLRDKIAAAKKKGNTKLADKYRDTWANTASSREDLEDALKSAEEHLSELKSK